MFRVPNYKKRFKARTTSKYKRQLKSAINPLYNKKGKRLLTNPERYFKDKAYHKMTFKLDKTYIGVFLYSLFAIGGLVFLLVRSWA